MNATTTVKRNYKYNGVIYPATITFKRKKNLSLRFDPEKQLLKISVPLRTTYKTIDDFVSRYIGKLVHAKPRKKSPYEEGFLYVFGEKVEVGELEPGEVMGYYKKIGLPYCQGRVEELAKLMGVDEPYKVRMRDMKRTLGSNSRATKTLTFQCRLMAFSKEIIDSVIVHELAHHFHFDHSKKFYQVVYRYCPDYNILRKNLIHDEFAYPHNREN